MPDTFTTISTDALPTSAVVEFRPYEFKPGRRDDFNARFEALIPELERAGQHIHGQFRDANNPDRQIWLRGYDDMDHRLRSLTEFYERNPVWKEHRAAVNDTFTGLGDTRLLKPVDEPRFTLSKKVTAYMVMTMYLLNSAVDDGFMHLWRERMKPALAAAGAPPVATLATEYSADNFLRIPIAKPGEHAFIWFAAYGSPDEYRLHKQTLAASKIWAPIEAELSKRLASPPKAIELIPTAYTLARHGVPYRYSMAVTGDVHDFDFLDGKWEMVNRRLVKRGVGSKEWDTFPATVTAHVMLGGVTNVDEVVFPTKGWAGTTFRHFDLEKKQWSIYWVNSRDGKMQGSAQVGGFDGDVGLFYGDDVDEGRPVRVVYKWTRVGPDGARWEQAFSYDDGKTWETNWVNEHRRVK